MRFTPFVSHPTPFLWLSLLILIQCFRYHVSRLWINTNPEIVFLNNSVLTPKCVSNISSSFSRIFPTIRAQQTAAFPSRQYVPGKSLLCHYLFYWLRVLIQGLKLVPGLKLDQQSPLPLTSSYQGFCVTTQKWYSFISMKKNEECCIDCNGISQQLSSLL